MNIQIIKREANPEENDFSRVLFLVPSPGEATAEDLAMLQALYSRDPRPIDDAVKLLKTSNSGTFMEKFYVNYGHASIAELGNVVIAIENVPMPVAKLIQHYQLYKGQECSTRYIDFSKQRFISTTPEGQSYQEELRQFYLDSMEPTVEHMIRQHGLDREDKIQVKSAKAAAFDVLRGFLPCGVVTNLAWTVDLRNLNEHLGWMWGFIDEFLGLQTVLEKIESLFREIFPTSARIVHQSQPELYSGLVNSKVRLHEMELSTKSVVEWRSSIDFASWRDLARHRSIYQTFPRISTSLGFETWYINNLPKSIQSQATDLIRKAKYDDIYSIPMGYRVPFYCYGPLDKFRYIIKLRSGMTVHPTLRHRIIQLAEDLTWLRHQVCAPNLADELEYDSNLEWVVNTKRGQQDIVQKA